MASQLDDGELAVLKRIAAGGKPPVSERLRTKLLELGYIEHRLGSDVVTSRGHDRLIKAESGNHTG